MLDIELFLLRGQPTMEQTSLGVADAGSAEDGIKGQVVWMVVVPQDYPPGPAILKTEGSAPLKVRILKLREG